MTAAADEGASADAVPPARSIPRVPSLRSPRPLLHGPAHPQLTSLLAWAPDRTGTARQPAANVTIAAEDWERIRAIWADWERIIGTLQLQRRETHAQLAAMRDELAARRRSSLSGIWLAPSNGGVGASAWTALASSATAKSPLAASDDQQNFWAFFFVMLFFSLAFLYVTHFWSSPGPHGPGKFEMLPEGTLLQIGEHQPQPRPPRPPRPPNAACHAQL